ncbi:MAG: helix-turn-helix domain-containing protein [Anaerolineae bacterium]|nr:helix-turn-helix domain-containing protein [Anaerolineae bacterium]MCA9893292.1 helix-turn-helix domain-containing protein [Anaerolineae bacterium]
MPCSVYARQRLSSLEDITVARALLSDPSITVEQIAERLVIAASTLYRYFSSGRSDLDT